VATRDYRSETLTVHWDSEVCIHSGHCVQALRSVFDPKRRPWIMVENAEDDRIAEAVEGCPSGALRYTRHDDPDAPPPPPATTMVVVNENGPLEVMGEIEVIDADGQTVRRGQHLYLCRCGNSRNKPYCDGSHRRVRFEDPGRPPPA
jgi:uncharacterized Fe-S cluster protein YjdI/CDGSH-type Zn-finger protein